MRPRRASGVPLLSLAKRPTVDTSLMRRPGVRRCPRPRYGHLGTGDLSVGYPRRPARPRASLRGQQSERLARHEVCSRVGRRDLEGPGGEGRADGLHPTLDLAPADGTERPAAERRVGVGTEVALGSGCGARTVHLRDARTARVVAKERPPTGGVDVHAACQLVAYGVEEPIGVSFAGELTGLLRSTGVLPPPCPVPASRSLVAVRHSPLHRPRRLSPVLDQSSGSPQLRGRQQCRSGTSGHQRQRPKPLVKEHIGARIRGW